MIHKSAVTRRILAMNEALDELRAHPEASREERLATDAMLRAAVERWLQVAVETCIDLAHHVIAESGWTPPTSARGAFQTLAAHGIIEPELATRLGRAAGLRNVLVHEYAEVDLAIVAGVVRDDLADLKAFAERIGRQL